MLISKLFGTKYPLIQGGMANIATAQLASAVSNAGGLGLIGAGGMNAEMLRDNIRKCREMTSKPFGVNIMLMHPLVDEMAKIVIEEGVKVVTTGAGNPAKYIESWKAAGILVAPVVPSATIAKRVADTPQRRAIARDAVRELVDEALAEMTVARFVEKVKSEPNARRD